MSNVDEKTTLREVIKLGTAENSRNMASSLLVPKVVQFLDGRRSRSLEIWKQRERSLETRKCSPTLELLLHGKAGLVNDEDKVSRSRENSQVKKYWTKAGPEPNRSWFFPWRSGLYCYP